MIFESSSQARRIEEREVGKVSHKGSRMLVYPMDEEEPLKALGGRKARQTRAGEMGSRSRCKTGRDLGDREGSGPCCHPQRQQCGCPLGTQPSLSVSHSFKPQTLPLEPVDK